MLAGAHHPKSPADLGIPMHRTDHRQGMRAFEGVPMMVEEGVDTMKAVSDGAWVRNDGVADRHMKGGTGGSGNIAYHDGHAGRVFLPMPEGADKDPQWKVNYFHADTMCIRTTGGKWINGRQAKTKKPGNYGMIMSSPSADEDGAAQHY